MSHLLQVVRSLSADELADFRLHFAKKGKQAKGYRLFSLISQRRDELKNLRDLLPELYELQDRKSFNKLCSRVTDELIQFIVRRNLRDAMMHSSGHEAMLITAQHMYRKGLFDESAYYLKRAETSAITNRDTAALIRIYDAMLEYAVPLNISSTIISDKLSKCLTEYVRWFQLKQLAASFREDNKVLRSKGNRLDMKNNLRWVKGQMQLTPEEWNNPFCMVYVFDIVRSSASSSKNYLVAERFMESNYKRLNRHLHFTPADMSSELRLIWMTAHAKYRNGKFDQARNWIELYKAKSDNHYEHEHTHLVRYAMLRAAIECYSGHLDQAISIATQAIRKFGKHGLAEDIINLKLNLAVYHFFDRNFKRSLMLLKDIDADLIGQAGQMGKEWVFKKQMITVLTHYDMAQDDVAIELLKQVKKVNAKGLFEKPGYQNAAKFVELLLEGFRNPLKITTTSFRNKVKTTSDLWSMQVHDIQAVAFFSWLKSKMNDEDCYRVMLKSLKEMRSGKSS